ncbi:MAG: hypothetical protein M3292_04400 [Actinomycetota bacterium]|nr:hypothetical protein [Actinomycetota bacterium]
MSAIERYLGELERELQVGGRRRQRILAEAEDHLREAARDVGEEAAVARFGQPAELARRFAADEAESSGRRAAQLLTIALALAFLAVYPIPENTLPPAPWPGDTPPHYLHWKQNGVAALFLVAVLAGVLAFLLARGYRLRSALSRRALAPALALTVVSVVALAAMLVLGAILAYQWQEAVPGAPGPAWIAAYTCVQTLVLAVVALLAVRAARAATAELA